MEYNELMLELEKLKEENNKLKFMNHVLKNENKKNDKILFGLKQEIRYYNGRIKALINK